MGIPQRNNILCFFNLFFGLSKFKETTTTQHTTLVLFDLSTLYFVERLMNFFHL